MPRNGRNSGTLFTFVGTADCRMHLGATTVRRTTVGRETQPADDDRPQSRFGAFQEGQPAARDREPPLGHGARAGPRPRAEPGLDPRGLARRLLPRRAGPGGAGGVRAGGRARPGERLRPLRLGLCLLRAATAIGARAPPARGRDAARPSPHAALARVTPTAAACGPAWDEPPVVCCDLDGVIWRGDEPIPGAAERRRCAARLPVGFVSNNSSVPVGEVAAKLGRSASRRRGSRAHERDGGRRPARRDDAAAGASSRCAGPGVFEALAEGRIEVGARRAAEAVVVGFHRTVRLRRARPGSTRCACGRPLRRHQPRRDLSDPRGPAPGRRLDRRRGGHRVEARARGRGQARGAAVRRWSATGSGDRGVVVGDRPSTDGALADPLGWPFALVLSGVASHAPGPGEEPVPDPPPPFVGDDLPRSYRPRRRTGPAYLVGRAGVRRRVGPRGSGGRVVEAPARRRARAARSRRLPTAAARLIGDGRVAVAGAGHHLGRRSTRADHDPRRTGPKYVSRGGTKLAGALGPSPSTSPAGGSSTPARPPAGSPTACSSGAPRSSVAVDVGRGQLAWRIREDPRRGARAHERPHARARALGAWSTWSSPTSRSSRCGSSRPRSSLRTAPTPTSCSS